MKLSEYVLKLGYQCFSSKRKSASDANGDKADGEPDAKKSKMDDATKEKLKKQMKKMYYYRDMLEKLDKKELVELLEYNDQEVPTGNDKVK